MNKETQNIMPKNNISLNNKNILITGAVGFIGANLVISLFKSIKFIHIVGIDNVNDYYDVSLKKYRLHLIEQEADLHSDSSWVFIKGDIADKNLIQWVFDEYNPGIVVNLAAQAGVRYSISKPLHLRHPRTFNEKLQWLKLYDHNPEYIKMVDKYEVKKYVAGKIGGQYIIPTYGVWDSFDKIDFDILPDQFVLKCTHDSGGIVICQDKKNLDIDETRVKLNNRLKRNYYWVGREWPYKYVQPRIIAEKYMSDGNNNVLNDYKFMCFNGEVMCSFTCTDRFSNDGLKVTFYDRDWRRLPFKRHYEVSETDIKKPEQYEKMIQYSEILSQKIPFVRTDFYEINGQLYFGELTFYPGDGMEEFTPEEWDYVLGSWLKLPDGGGYTLNKDDVCLWIHPAIDEKKIII